MSALRFVSPNFALLPNKCGPLFRNFARKRFLRFSIFCCRNASNISAHQLAKFLAKFHRCLSRIVQRFFGIFSRKRFPRFEILVSAVSLGFASHPLLKGAVTSAVASRRVNHGSTFFVVATQLRFRLRKVRFAFPLSSRLAENQVGCESWISSAPCLRAALRRTYEWHREPDPTKFCRRSCPALRLTLSTSLPSALPDSDLSSIVVRSSLAQFVKNRAQKLPFEVPALLR